MHTPRSELSLIPILAALASAFTSSAQAEITYSPASTDGPGGALIARESFIDVRRCFGFVCNDTTSLTNAGVESEIWRAGNHFSRLSPNDLEGNGSVRGQYTPENEDGNSYFARGRSELSIFLEVDEYTEFMLDASAQEGTSGTASFRLSHGDGAGVEWLTLAPRGDLETVRMRVVFAPGRTYNLRAYASAFGSGSGGTNSWEFSLVPVPEPGTALLFGAGLVLLARHRRP